MNERYNYDCNNVEWKCDDDDRAKWYGDRTQFIASSPFQKPSRSSSTPPSYFSPFRHGSRDRVSCTENVSEKGTTIKWNKYLSPPRHYSVYMPSFTTSTASLTDLYIQLKLYDECIVILLYICYCSGYSDWVVLSIYSGISNWITIIISYLGCVQQTCALMILEWC